MSEPFEETHALLLCDGRRHARREPPRGHYMARAASAVLGALTLL